MGLSHVHSIEHAPGTLPILIFDSRDKSGLGAGIWMEMGRISTHTGVGGGNLHRSQRATTGDARDKGYEEDLILRYQKPGYLCTVGYSRLANIDVSVHSIC